MGTDTHFGPETVTETIGKSRAGVDHHAGRIDLAQKALGVHVVGGEDGVGVVAGIAVDVGDGLVHAVHQLHADHRRQVFLAPVLLTGGGHVRARHGRQDGHGGGGARGVVHHGGTAFHRRRARLAGHGHHAGVGLHHAVVGGQLALGAGAAESRDGAV